MRESERERKREKEREKERERKREREGWFLRESAIAVIRPTRH